MVAVLVKTQLIERAENNVRIILRMYYIGGHFLSNQVFPSDTTKLLRKGRAPIWPSLLFLWRIRSALGDGRIDFG